MTFGQMYGQGVWIVRERRGGARGGVIVGAVIVSAGGGVVT